jgi:hypothetical protein
MITEIKNFSNKTLKDVMMERLYKKIVLQSINSIQINEISNEIIFKLRNEIKEFFIELHNQSLIMKI